jgi:hypothetical protein
MLPQWRRCGLTLSLATFRTDWEPDIPKSNIPVPGMTILAKACNQIPILRKCYERYRLNKIVRQLVRFVSEHPADLIFSFANPMEANFIGMHLHKATGLPFIAHYSDPFVNNPYKRRPITAEDLARKREKRMLKSAARIVFVSEELKNRVLAQHEEDLSEKTIVIPHCFSPEAYPERPIGWANDSIFRISHIGAFYKERPPEAFLAGLDCFKNKYSQFASRLQVDFIGADLQYTDYSGETLRDLIAKYDFNFPVNITPSVSYKESLAAMKASHALVAIDKDMKDSPFLPSKIFDYIGSGTYVLAFTPQNSPTAHVVSQCGGVVFGYSKKDAMEFADHIADLMELQVPKTLSSCCVRTYSVESQAAKFISVFKEVIDG